MGKQSARIALQPRELSSLHRTTTPPPGIVVLRQVNDRRQRRIHIPFTRLETCFVSDGRHLVPGTYVLTNVATIKPTFQMLSDFRRDFGGPRFNGGVRNTAIRVD